MLPYRTRDNHIAGVVVTFSDITARKQAADAANEARIYAEAIVENDPAAAACSERRSARQVGQAGLLSISFMFAAQETAGRLVYELGNGQWDIPTLRTLLDEVLSKNQAVIDFEVEHEFRDLGRRCMLLNASKLSRTAAATI